MRLPCGSDDNGIDQAGGKQLLVIREALRVDFFFLQIVQRALDAIFVQIAHSSDVDLGEGEKGGAEQISATTTKTDKADSDSFHSVSPWGRKNNSNALMIAQFAQFFNTFGEK
jgi:hypothetical protein